jgi:hypothetical protein
MNAPVIKQQVEMLALIEIFRGLHQRQIKSYRHPAAEIFGQIAPMFNIINDLHDFCRSLINDRICVEDRRP